MTIDLPEEVGDEAALAATLQVSAVSRPSRILIGTLRPGRVSMNEALVEIGRAQQLIAWAVMLTAFLTFLAVLLGMCVAFLVRREGRALEHIRAGKARFGAVLVT